MQQTLKFQSVEIDSFVDIEAKYTDDNYFSSEFRVLFLTEGNLSVVQSKN